MTRRLIGSSCGVACVVLCGVFVVACQAPRVPADAAAATRAGRVGDRVISMAEVDAKWHEMSAAEELQAQEAVYRGRRAALDAIIGDYVIARAAEKEGLSVERYLTQELARRTQQVTPTDVESFYYANKEQVGDRSLDEVRPAILDVLERRRREAAREALLAELRADAGGTGIWLEPPRQRVNLLPEDPVRGVPSAPVTIVEFSDYQCPYCGRLAPTLAKVQAEFGERVRVVWKDFPLEEIHPRAVDLARAARCAGDQNKYWEFHDHVFSDQAAAATASWAEFARTLGIEERTFTECVKSKRYATAITEGQEAGHALGVDSTPTMFVNGHMIAGAQPYEVLARAIDDELAHSAP